MPRLLSSEMDEMSGMEEKRKGKESDVDVQSNRSLPDFDFLSSGYPKIPPYNRVRCTSATILPIYRHIVVSFRADLTTRLKWTHVTS